ncbi:hypothetical protein [Sphingobium sp. YBL2]|uniref:hypothetical protein n=1 Tax=Sphingobium sp. (strain YBL2) TaxID=484429 RepID=UPI0012EEBD7C|nr:hypothetical protein [Sphingobium sp. YBL2]
MQGTITNEIVGETSTCYLQYTVTIRTHLHSRKRSFRRILAATLPFANGVMGFAALHQRRHIKNSYSTPFVFQHRIRAAIQTINDRELEKGPIMEGEVEIDGMFVTGKKVKPKKPITDEKELEKFFDKYRETHTALVDHRVLDFERLIPPKRSRAAT